MRQPFGQHGFTHWRARVPACREVLNLSDVQITLRTNACGARGRAPSKGNLGLIFLCKSISVEKVAKMKMKFAALLFGFSIGHSLASGQIRLESPSMHNGATVASEQLATDCGGKNHSPALAWSGAPAGTKSFAITLLDPDAPSGDFWHWVVFDLPVQIDRLRVGAGNGSLPGGAKQTRNDYGGTGYGGPCPPPGSTHRYILTIYALDIDHLPATAATSPGQVVALIGKHALAKSAILARYGR